MAFSIYKSGQGYWTRMLSAIGLGAIVLAGVAWLWGQFQGWFNHNTVYYQGGMAVSVIVFFGLLAWYLLGRKVRIVDFMIATEAEMKKVNWPSRKEIFGSTIVVIAGTLLMASLLWLINICFAALFQAVGILQSG